MRPLQHQAYEYYSPNTIAAAAAAEGFARL
jgi:hypothetical protein